MVYSCFCSLWTGAMAPNSTCPQYNLSVNIILVFQDPLPPNFEGPSHKGQYCYLLQHVLFKLTFLVALPEASPNFLCLHIPSSFPQPFMTPTTFKHNRKSITKPLIYLLFYHYQLIRTKIAPHALIWSSRPWLPIYGLTIPSIPSSAISPYNNMLIQLYVFIWKGHWLC